MRVSAFLMAILGLGLAGCGKAPERTRAEPAAPVAVQIMTVAQAEWPSSYEAVGTVRARTAAVISSKVMGYVREVKAETGDRVRPGQLLVVLDARDLDAGFRQAEAARNEAQSATAEVENAVAAAKAQLDLSEVTFRRMKDLFDKRSISNQEFDEAAARRKLAQANYEMAVSKRAQLGAKIQQAEQAVRAAGIARGYAEIAAPFAGVITEKRVDPGNLATPGAPLLTIEQESGYRLEASIEESHVASIRPGQPAEVVLDALGRRVEGRVSEVVPTVDAAARAFIAKIDLPGVAQLRSGMFGRARFALGKRPVMAVPAGAVQERGQLRSVFVAEGGQARARLVTLGAHSGDSTEVLSGLNPGERIVFPVPAGLSDGARVEVRP